MNLHQEIEKSSRLMLDIDRWNSMTVTERARLLRVDPWAEFNRIAAQLDPGEVSDLKNHPEFRPLREAFTFAQVKGSPTDLVEKVIDLLCDAVSSVRATRMIRAN